MKPEFNSYLAELEHAMSGLPPAERADAIREISSHLSDAAESGAAPQVLLDRLGSPKTLAAAMVADRLDRRTQTPLDIRRAVIASSFFAGSSFTSLFVVPLLGFAAVAFGLLAALSPVFGILRTLGASWIQINFAPNQSLPTEWSIPFTLALGAVCLGIAWLAYKGLRLYLRLLAHGYRRVMQPS